MGLFSAQSVSALRRPRRGSLSRRWGRVRCCAGSLLSGHLAARVAGAPAMSKEGWDEKDIVSSTWSKEALVYTGEPGVRCSAAEDLRLLQRRARPRAPPRAGTGRWWVRGARRARIARAAPQGASAPARRHVFLLGCLLPRLCRSCAPACVVERGRVASRPLIMPPWRVELPHPPLAVEGACRAPALVTGPPPARCALDRSDAGAALGTARDPLANSGRASPRRARGESEAVAGGRRVEGGKGNACTRPRDAGLSEF